MESSSSDDDVDTKLTHLFKITKRKPSIALLDDKNRVKYCLNTKATDFHSSKEEINVKNDTSQSPSVPFLILFYGCFPILNWKWYIPPRWFHLTKNESRISGVSSDAEKFDYYPVSKEARTFHDLRSFCCFTIFSIYSGAFLMFFWSRVLVIEPYTSNQLYGFFMMFCVILFLNAFFVKKEFYCFKRGMLASAAICTVLLSTLILVSGGIKSPVCMSLFGLISVLSSFVGQRAGNYLGAYVLLFDVFLLLYPGCSISLVDENYQVMVTLQEKFISIAITLLVVHRNFLQSEREKTVLENCVIHSLYADKSKSFFLASTAHEMRTPLHHMNLVNMLLVERMSTFLTIPSSDSRIAKHHDEVLGLIKQGQNATQLLLRLLDDALDLSKIEVGDIPLKIRSLNVDAPVTNTYQMFLRRAEEKNIQYTLEDRTAEINTIYADETRLVQMLSNLIGNALKFTPSGGTVKVIIERKTLENYKGDYEGDEGDRICISVEDNGIGISSKELKSIFFPFYQVDGQSTTRKYGGGGLGLAITRKLAKLVDADVTVQSTEGVGSVFSIWFQPHLGSVESSSSEEETTIDDVVDGERNEPKIESRNLSIRNPHNRRVASTKMIESTTLDVTPAIIFTSATPTTSNDDNNNNNNININGYDKHIDERMTAAIITASSTCKDNSTNNYNNNINIEINSNNINHNNYNINDKNISNNKTNIDNDNINSDNNNNDNDNNDNKNDNNNNNNDTNYNNNHNDNNNKNKNNNKELEISKRMGKALAKSAPNVTLNTENDDNNALLRESNIETLTSKLVRSDKESDSRKPPNSSNCVTTIRKKGKRKRVKTTTNKVLEGSNIIICDDNVVSLKLLSVMLKKLGCHVTTFEHPRDLLTTFKQSLLQKLKRKKIEEQALNENKILKNHPTTVEDLDTDCLEFDFLLLDLYMPELDGFDVAKAIRQMELEYRQYMSVPLSSIPSYPSTSLNSLFSSPFLLGSSENLEWSSSKHKDTYIMALSATSKVDDRTKALQECQMDFFMNKPFELSNLTGVLTDVKRKRDGIKLMIGEE